MEGALASPPRRQREAVVVRYYLQMDTREVAEVLHMSEGTTFLLKGTFLNVVDVTEFTWPIDDERRPFLDTGVCGTDLST